MRLTLSRAAGLVVFGLVMSGQAQPCSAQAAGPASDHPWKDGGNPPQSEQNFIRRSDEPPGIQCADPEGDAACVAMEKHQYEACLAQARAGDGGPDCFLDLLHGSWTCYLLFC